MLLDHLLTFRTEAFDFTVILINDVEDRPRSTGFLTASTVLPNVVLHFGGEAVQNFGLRETDRAAEGLTDDLPRPVFIHPRDFPGKVGGVDVHGVNPARRTVAFAEPEAGLSAAAVLADFAAVSGRDLGMSGIDVAIDECRCVADVEIGRDGDGLPTRNVLEVDAQKTHAGEALQKFIRPEENTARTTAGDDDVLADGFEVILLLAVIAATVRSSQGGLSQMDSRGAVMVSFRNNNKRLAGNLIQIGFQFGSGEFLGGNRLGCGHDAIGIVEQQTRDVLSNCREQQRSQGHAQQDLFHDCSFTNYGCLRNSSGRSTRTRANCKR